MNSIFGACRQLTHLLRDFLSLLFPDLCCGCNNHLNRGESGICSSCLFQIPYTDHHLYADNKTARHLWGKVPFHAAMSLLYFRKGERVQRIIHHLKYRGRKETGTKLGLLMGKQLRNTSFYMDIDLIIPVPLHKAKEKKRGYNQSFCIAGGIAAELNLPVGEKIIIRKIATESQTGKGRYNRQENMQNAFCILNCAAVKGRHVLLVDDVITTGATIEACAAELHKCNISKLSIIAAACAE